MTKVIVPKSALLLLSSYVLIILKQKLAFTYYFSIGNKLSCSPFRKGEAVENLFILLNTPFFMPFSTKTDIMLGKNCGLQTLFVDSGVDRLTEVRGWKTSGGSDGLEAEKNRVPDFFANKLGDLLPLANSVMSS